MAKSKKKRPRLPQETLHTAAAKLRKITKYPLRAAIEKAENEKDNNLFLTSLAKINKQIGKHVDYLKRDAYTLDRMRVLNKRRVDIVRNTFSELASEAFKNLTVNDLIDTKTYSLVNNPNFAKLIDLSSLISSYVEIEILAINDPDYLLVEIEHWIYVAEECTNHNDFFTAQAIYQGLSNNNVMRLFESEGQYPGLSKEAAEAYKRLNQKYMASPTNNKNLAQAVADATPPKLPSIVYFSQIPEGMSGSIDMIRTMINEAEEKLKTATPEEAVELKKDIKVWQDRIDEGNAAYINETPERYKKMYSDYTPHIEKRKTSPEFKSRVTDSESKAFELMNLNKNFTSLSNEIKKQEKTPLNKKTPAEVANYKETIAKREELRKKLNTANYAREDISRGLAKTAASKMGRIKTQLGSLMPFMKKTLASEPIPTPTPPSQNKFVAGKKSNRESKRLKLGEHRKQVLPASKTIDKESKLTLGMHRKKEELPPPNFDLPPLLADLPPAPNLPQEEKPQTELDTKQLPSQKENRLTDSTSKITHQLSQNKKQAEQEMLKPTKDIGFTSTKTALSENTANQKQTKVKDMVKKIEERNQETHQPPPRPLKRK